VNGVDPDWRGWPLERLEREYSPSSCVPSIEPLIRAYAQRSAAAYDALAHVAVPYGDDPDETVDLFPAGGRAPLVVFVHGGYWQELSRRESTFGATDAVPRGIAWAAVEYTLAPRASLARIVEQCRRAVRRLCAQAASLGCDPSRVWLAGSSAGAHLAAMALLDPLARTGPRPAGAILLSGVYDLRPLVPTYVNRPLGLDEARAWALSPLAQAPPDAPDAPDTPDTPPDAPDVLVAWGEHETASFVAQSRRYARALRPRAAELEVPGRNHFDLVFDLLAPGTVLGDAVLGRICSRP
jgi:arylformamidase